MEANKRIWERASVLLKIPEPIRQILYDSGVYMVNDKFASLYESDNFLIDIYGGRGSGKSHHITDYADYMLSQSEYCRILFLRYVDSDIKLSLWGDFIDRVTEKGNLNEYKFNHTDKSAVHIKTGNKLFSKGVLSSKDRTAKLKSVAGFTIVIEEEADEIPPTPMLKIKHSMRKKGSKLRLIRSWNTARKTHHIYDDYTLTPTKHEGYFTAEALPSSGILSIHATFEDNIHNLNNEFVSEYSDELRWKDKNLYLTDALGLIPSGLVGQIYTGWKRISLADYNELQYNKYYGLDWGTNDPLALVEAKIHKQKVFLKGLHYKPLEVTSQKGLPLVGMLLCDLGFNEKDIIICDSSEPSSIMRLRGYTADELEPDIVAKYPQLLKGFSTIGVGRAPKFNKPRIDERIKQLQQLDVYVVMDEDSEPIWNESLTYCWGVDKDGKPTDQPIDKDNHYLDAINYITWSVM
jgi:phage terminase large subunit